MKRYKTTFAHFAALFLPLLPLGLAAQSFTEMTGISAVLQSGKEGSVAWGDYDNDNDLDLVLSAKFGSQSPYTPYTRLYRNDGATFTDIPTTIPDVYSGTLVWGDYDNDNDLDLVVTGQGTNSNHSKIFQNTGGVFTDIGAGLMPLKSSNAAWGDYDNDGDLDLLFCGVDDNIHGYAFLYRNDHGIFNDSQLGIGGGSSGSLEWGDYDADGDLDLLASTEIWRNDGGTFVDINAGMTSVSGGSVTWTDYDNDGDLDVLTMGNHNNYDILRFYRNEAGTFTNLGGIGLPITSDPFAAWGDYDNDGDLDVMITGRDEIALNFKSRVYRNDAGLFQDIGAGITGISWGCSAWGDYDNDGDLDIVELGASSGVEHTRVYRNNGTVANTPPSPPTGLTVAAQGNTALQWTWNAPTDDFTPALGLTYRLWIGTTTTDFDISGPMADTATGLRKIAAPGNLKATSWTLQNVVPGQTYFGCVSAIDGGMMGSPCSNQASVLVGFPDPATGHPITITAGPNPTTDRIHVAMQHSPSSKGIAYTLTTLAGQPIDGYSGTLIAELDLDLTKLAAGTYFLRLESQQTTKTESLRIIKQ